MQAYAKTLGVVLLALAIQLVQASVAEGQSGIFVSRAFTVTNNTSNIYVSRAFTVVNNTSNIYVSRAFTVVNNTSNIYVSRAFTVVNSDCNGNGIPDQCDVDPACGQSLDCNNNGCPDECETDCDGNGIPDDCDIANCLPGDPACADCNGNGILDPCDIASGIDGDCNLNGVPDECDLAFGPSLDVSNNMTGLPGADGIPDECINWSDGAPNTLWTDQANWEAGVVPGIGVPADVESPGINLDGTIVDLNVIASVDSLILGVNSTLNISAGNLTIDSPNGIQNEGIFNIDDAFSLTAASAMTITGLQPIHLTGPTARISSALLGDTLTSQVTILGQGIIDADFVNDASVSVIATSGGILQIADPTMPKINDGLFKAVTGGTLRINAPITGSGSYIADHGTIEINDDITGTLNADVRFILIGGLILISDLGNHITVDGCGPIDERTGSASLFTVDNASLINASSWTIGDANVGPTMTATMELLNGSIGFVNGPVAVKQNGTLRICNSSLTANSLTLDPGANLEVAGSLVLSGSFMNSKFDGTSSGVPCPATPPPVPCSWCWAPGSILTFTGGQAASVAPCSLTGWATLEAISADTGAGGGVNDFALRDIQIAAGSHISLVDLTANHSPAVIEALYCDNLTLGAGAVLNLNGLNLYVNGVAMSPGPSGGGDIEDVPRAALLNPLGDVNGDGLADIGDISGFVAVLLGQDTDPVNVCTADLNADGIASGLDVQAFINLILP